LNVPLVPIFSLLVLKQKPTRGAIIGIILSVIGLTLLSMNNSFHLTFGFGELLILGAAFAFAMQIVCISKFAPHADAVNLAIIQLAFTSLLSFIAVPLTGASFILPSLPIWGSFCLWVQEM
jgi:drug/metabolite transporter (DMT)-like permease